MKPFIAIVLLSVPIFGSPQDPTLGAENPLAQLKGELENVLIDAGLPFTEEHYDAIVLMMEDRRRASEELFGELLNFSAGPTQGQDADRLNSAIEWMRGEFLLRLEDYSTEEQNVTWSLHRETSDTGILATSEAARRLAAWRGST